MKNLNHLVFIILTIMNKVLLMVIAVTSVIVSCNSNLLGDGMPTDGKARYAYADSSVYDGEWKAGKRSGHGVA